MGMMYGMQRANGDWFAVKSEGGLRMPVFRSSSDAMQARARNSGMLLFKPVVIDELALMSLAPEEGEGVASFWLVDNPFANLNRSHLVEHAHLASLVRDAAQELQG